MVLHDARASRGRFYPNIFSFAIRFEADDTSAYGDTARSQSVLKMLELPVAREEVAIPAANKTPA